MPYRWMHRRRRYILHKLLADINEAFILNVGSVIKMVAEYGTGVPPHLLVTARSSSSPRVSSSPPTGRMPPQHGDSKDACPLLPLNSRRLGSALHVTEIRLYGLYAKNSLS